MDNKVLKRHIMILLKENNRLKKQIRYDIMTATNKAVKERGMSRI